MSFVPTLFDPPLQEIVRLEEHGPWRVGAVTLMLVATTRRQVDGVYRDFFGSWESPQAAALSGSKHLEPALEPTGLQHQKAFRIWWLSIAYQRIVVDGGHDPLDFPIERMPGCGAYVRDAWRIFVRRELDFEPCDAVLKEWLRVINSEEAKRWLVK